MHDFNKINEELSKLLPNNTKIRKFSENEHFSYRLEPTSYSSKEDLFAYEKILSETRKKFNHLYSDPPKYISAKIRAIALYDFFVN